LKPNFYVYEHWRPDTNQCFYVGKGTGRRAYAKGKNKRNLWWTRVVDKLQRDGMSHDVHIVKSGLTEAEAIALEIECIKFWREIGAELVNMTDGGEGASGRNTSETTKTKLRNSSLKAITTISAANRGRTPWNKGKFSKKFKILKKPLKGVHSDEARAKMSAAVSASMTAERRAEIGALYSKKTVCVTDGKVFPSVAAAAKYYGIGRSLITRVCIGKYSETWGLVFAYVETGQ
jgi:hypothetical protein